jgi:hypothetical protein
MRALISFALICLFQDLALAEEKAAIYQISTTATQFNEKDNTYTFEVRFTAHPCPEVNYQILFYPTGKNSDEAIAKVQPQIDKIAADLTKDQNKHCHAQ